MSGIKAQIAVTADTETEVYEVPVGTVGDYDLIIQNDTESAGTVQIWFTETATSAEKRAMRLELQQMLRVRGLLLNAGQKIIIETTQDAVCTVLGGEGNA